MDLFCVVLGAALDWSSLEVQTAIADLAARGQLHRVAGPPHSAWEAVPGLPSAEYSEGFGPDDFSRLREIVLAFARDGPLEAGDLFSEILFLASHGDIGWTPGDIAAMLTDLTELGYLRRLPETTRPTWVIA